MKPTRLVTGLADHPTHPPLPDAAIGLYIGAAAFAVLSALGVAEANLALAWWLALVAGLVVTVRLVFAHPAPVWQIAAREGVNGGAAARKTPATQRTRREAHTGFEPVPPP